MNIKEILNLATSGFVITSGIYLALSAFYTNRALRAEIYVKRIENMHEARKNRVRSGIFLAITAISAMIMIFVS